MEWSNRWINRRRGADQADKQMEGSIKWINRWRGADQVDKLFGGEHQLDKQMERSRSGG